MPEADGRRDSGRVAPPGSAEDPAAGVPQEAAQDPEDAAPADATPSEDYQRGLDELERGEFEAAVRALRRAVAGEPVDPEPWRALGLALSHLERWDQAEQAFDRGLANAADDPDLLYRKGLCQIRAGRSSAAEDSLGRAAAAGRLEAHFQLGLLYAGGARRRSQGDQPAIGHFEAILQAVDEGAEFAGLDRVCFAVGGLYGEDSATRQQAVRAYRRGLSVNPLSPAGHTSLGVLLLQGGQVLGALGEFKVAIQLDPEFRAPHTHLARLFFHHMKPEELTQEYEHIGKEFGDLAPQVLSRVSLELMELGRQQAYEGLYTRGHQLKNLIGILGSRLRSVGRKARGTAPWAEELSGLIADHERLYEEWVAYLGAMKPERAQPAIVDPARLVLKVAETIRSHAGQNRLQVRVQDGVPRIQADERMLREAITNLCLNGLEAMGEADGQVTLGVGYDDGREMVFVEVEDSGPGIPADDLDRIFAPGFTTKERGNGYGLTIARRLAQAHHGELRVKSRVGHGTVFRLDVPVNFEAPTGPESLGHSYL